MDHVIHAIMAVYMFCSCEYPAVTFTEVHIHHMPWLHNAAQHNVVAAAIPVQTRTKWVLL